MASNVTSMAGLFLLLLLPVCSCAATTTLSSPRFALERKYPRVDRNKHGIMSNMLQESRRPCTTQGAKSSKCSSNTPTPLQQMNGKLARMIPFSKERGRRSISSSRSPPRFVASQAMMPAAFMSMWEVYLQYLSTNPLTTKVHAVLHALLRRRKPKIKENNNKLRKGENVGFRMSVEMATNGLMTAGGDVLAQNIENRAKNDSGGKKFVYDLRRGTVMACIGFLFTAPLLHAWYNIMHAFFSPDSIGGNMLASLPAAINAKFALVLSLLVADQLVFSPFAIAMFFVVNGVATALSKLELDHIRQIWPTLKREYVQTMIKNWKLWPSAQVINFTLVPVHLQVLFSNFIGLIWNTLLSLAAYRKTG